jgi:hypothetical protein
MARGRLYLVAPLVALGLFGCRAFNYEERAPWRAEAEAQCVSQRLVQASAYVEPASEISGDGPCGLVHPFKVQAAGDGKVTMQPQATLTCPMTAAFERWLNEIAQPAAQAWFGESIVEVRQLSSYYCRRIGGTGTMSEHGYGNAIDVAGFTFTSGRIVTVKRGWSGSSEERGFLRQVHAGGCDVFTTVLGPGYDAAHHDHFHFDLARRNSVVCRPTPQLISPPRQPFRYPNEPGPMVNNQKNKHYERFPIARVQPHQQQVYGNDDTSQKPYVPRAKQQPLSPEQAYPPVSQQQQVQQRPLEQPLAINPQQQNYPPQQPQYMQQGSPQYQQPQYSQPQPYPQQPRMQWQQGPQPDPNYRPSPDRLMPPARVGSKKNVDEILTGSIKNRKYYKDVPATKKDAPKAIPGED